MGTVTKEFDARLANRPFLSTHANRQGVSIYHLLFVCCLFVCLFAQLRISPPRIKLAATNFARRFIGE